ncbi:DeoR/GlpR family transcriptional regulator of sugar metabolism [Peribacillus deserti]|uniref:DeoR/GlpR family transcriptional regulator of sugar metabolism n=1 Tax=Peribacillus deserti TaxID=673318 RepID=A0ABS2QM03_9BACI|nr:DeoR/GlpR family DNA-binding transcription regulator [Peribacillus deserti]MBM7694207.1 DeoR/GlpR family transcriptional regulator of sugar metabolism [Peribacillus deserti]
MFSEERKKQIIELLATNERVLAKELADLFHVSIDSIRRDLTAMEEEGLLKRTHGGAIPIQKTRISPSPPAIRYSEGSEYDQAIAKLAAAQIKDQDTVFIGGASIHYAMLTFLPRDIHFTVVTNSVKIADSLREEEHIDLYLIGGKVKKSGNITDALSHEFIRHFNLDICFLTGGGLTATGLSTATPEVALGARLIAEHSRTVICLMGHHKFGSASFAKILPIAKLNLIITDEETSEDKIRMIKEQGTHIIVAKKEA